MDGRLNKISLYPFFTLNYSKLLRKDNCIPEFSPSRSLDAMFWLISELGFRKHCIHEKCVKRKDVHTCVNTLITIQLMVPVL